MFKRNKRNKWLDEVRVEFSYIYCFRLKNIKIKGTRKQGINLQIVYQTKTLEQIFYSLFV